MKKEDKFLIFSIFQIKLEWVYDILIIEVSEG